MTVARLADWSLLRFTGADAPAFLHGQLTCDVLTLKPGMSTYGGYCSPKGRLLATFLLCADADGFTMQLPAPIAEPIRKRLTMYVLRAKVKIEDVTTQRSCLGVTGSAAAQEVAALGGTVPQHPHHSTVHNDVTTIHLPTARYLVIMRQAPASAGERSDTWAAADVAAGIPFIVPATQEEFVPQMVNLDLIGGLSYSKGCYPGQEIVARTHYLGRLKQRMFRARVNAAAAAGDKLYCADLGDQAGGLIVTAVPDGAGGSDVLAVLRIADFAGGTYHLGSAGGALLEIVALPYKVA